MSFFKQIGIGIEAYARAISFVFKHNIWPYFAFPIVLNILLFVGGMAAIDSAIEWSQAIVMGYLQGNEDAWYSMWLNGAVSGLVWVMLKAIFFFVFAYFGGYIVLILMSPVFALISEKTEKVLTGKNYPFNADQFVRDLARGILIAFRNLFIEILVMVVCFFIGFIPVIGFLAPIALFFVSAYFYGFSFIDYWNERKKLTINQSVRYIRRNKAFSMTIGSVFALVLLIPFCGSMLAGFIAIVSVVAATLGAYEIDKSTAENGVQVNG